MTITRALEKELHRRLPLDPQSQLEVASYVDWNFVLFAATRLRAEYDPRRFIAYGDRAADAAKEISALIDDAVRQLAAERDLTAISGG